MQQLNKPGRLTFTAVAFIVGKIVWSTERDFGVKFDKAGVLQNDMLKSFVEQKE